MKPGADGLLMKLKAVEKAAAISRFPAFRIKFQSIQLFSSACATLVPFVGGSPVASYADILLARHALLPNEQQTFVGEECVTCQKNVCVGVHSGKTFTYALTLSISDRVVIFPRFVLRVVVLVVFKMKRALKVWVRFPHSPLR